MKSAIRKTGKRRGVRERTRESGWKRGSRQQEKEAENSRNKDLYDILKIISMKKKRQVAGEK